MNHRGHSSCRSSSSIIYRSRRPEDDDDHPSTIHSNENGNDHESTRRSRTSLTLMMKRSRFLATSMAGIFTSLHTHTDNKNNNNVAWARGLVQFPLTDASPALANTYHFMRAGQNLMEDPTTTTTNNSNSNSNSMILSTNPLFLTNREHALSDTGRQQVQNGAAKILNDPSHIPSIFKYSLAAHCMDTADLLKQELNVGESRLVREFVFLDPRAAGKWDGLPLVPTEEALWALDVECAGIDGTGTRARADSSSNADHSSTPPPPIRAFCDPRPPPNDDGTPNETLDNSVTKLRQLLSGLETQYSGETILLIFPDGTGPALLMCCLAGIPLERVHELNFEPGQLQLNVTRFTAPELLLLALPQQRRVDLYNAKLERGRDELFRLRHTDPNDIVSVRDKQFALEQEAKAIAIQVELDLQLQLERTKAQKQSQLAAATADNRSMTVTTGGSTHTDGQSAPPVAAMAGVAGVLGVAALALASSFVGADADGKAKEDDTNDNTDVLENNNNTTTTTGGAGTSDDKDSININGSRYDTTNNNTTTTTEEDSTSSSLGGQPQQQQQQTPMDLLPSLFESQPQNKPGASSLSSSLEQNNVKLFGIVDEEEEEAEATTSSPLGSASVSLRSEDDEDEDENVANPNNNNTASPPPPPLYPKPPLSFSSSSSQQQHKDEKQRQAQEQARAMDDYLNQDDGQQAWLSFLQEEVNEEQCEEGEEQGININGDAGINGRTTKNSSKDEDEEDNQ
jgi:broad specificity phosphatase PhoE